MASEFRHCRRCHKIFQYRGSVYCPGCVQEMDRQFTTVRDYMYDHPHASIDDIVDACNVDESDVLGWLREGRLILESTNSAVLSCERCGKGILTGRFCDACTSQVTDELQNSARDISRRRAEETPRDYDGPRMRSF